MSFGKLARGGKEEGREEGGKEERKRGREEGRKYRNHEDHKRSTNGIQPHSQALGEVNLDTRP